MGRVEGGRGSPIGFAADADARLRISDGSPVHNEHVCAGRRARQWLMWEVRRATQLPKQSKFAMLRAGARGVQDWTCRFWKLSTAGTRETEKSLVCVKGTRRGKM